MTDDGIKTIVYRRVVDLSHPISPDIPVWPGDPAVSFETVAHLSREGYYLRRFSMGEHSGTHLASPAAFDSLGSGPDDLPASSLILPATVMDVTGRVDSDADYALSVDDIVDWESRHETIAPGSLALLFTGWQRYWEQPERFINLGEDGMMHTPGFSAEAAGFLLRQRKVSGLGTDTHGIDVGVDTDLTVSRMALAESAVALECLNNLDRLPPTGATVIVGRLRLVGGSGSPAGVLALTP